MYWNDNEEKIIGNFVKKLKTYKKEVMELKWKDGSMIKARFDTCFEDENDYDESDPRYEELTSFVFKGMLPINDPNIEVSKDGYFIINYHNFPDEICVNGIRIN